jgi:hypothetical protein
MLSYEMSGACEWVRAPTMNPCTSFAEPWMGCSANSTWDPQLMRTLDGCCRSMRLEGSRAWSVASIACAHWQWKNCPSAWKVQYTYMLRDALLFLWHGLFSQWHQCAQLLSVFNRLMEGTAPKVNYEINCNAYW